jgi:hypothetical protein
VKATATPTAKTSIAGWAMSVLLSLFLIVPSAGGKFVDWEGKDKMFEHLGDSGKWMPLRPKMSQIPSCERLPAASDGMDLFRRSCSLTSLV